MRKLIAIGISMVFTSFAVKAQTPAVPEANPIVMTTYTLKEIPTGDTSFRTFSADSLLNYYVDKGIRPNPHVKNFRLLTHWWGANEDKIIFIYEINRIQNLNKADEKVNQLLEASFNTKEDRRYFWRQWNKIFGGHDDEIMGDMVKPKM